MKRFANFAPALAFGLVAGAVAPDQPVWAQAATAGPSGHMSVLLSSDRLGAGDLLGVGGRVVFAPSPYSAVGFGLTHFGSGTTELGRSFTALASSIDLEGTLVAGRTRVFGVLSPTLLSFDLGAPQGSATPGLGAERVHVPAVGGGLGLGFPLTRSISFEVLGRDVVTYSRDRVLDLGSLAFGPRGVSHSPEMRAQITIKLRKSEKVARFEDLPVSFSDNFRPVQASEIQSDLHKVTQGRDHIHTANEEIVTLEPPVQKVVLVEDHLLGTVYFADASFEVGSEFQRVVKTVAEYLQANPEARVRIKGFTSPTGSIRFNLSLAERRANSVRTHLVNFYRIAPDRVEALVGGIDPDSKAEEHARRAEIVEIAYKPVP